MGRTISDVVREICLGLPEATEVSSHGMADFRVGKKTFATYAVNHHGDGHVALWLPLPPGAQSLYAEAEPQWFFVPPYVGPRGWLGVDLDRGLDWGRIDALVREAHAHVAPARLAAAAPGAPRPIVPPDQELDPEFVNPLSAPHARALIERIRAYCAGLPETSETTQFGNPAWRAGRKTFCTVHRYRRRLELQVWVGADQQSLLTFDPRYRIPDYIGHNGWISLDVEDDLLWDEVSALLLQSYRHFALQRMLKALDG